MNLFQLAHDLQSLKSKTIFVHLSPEIFNFSSQELHLFLISPTKEIKIPLKSDFLIQIVGLLQASLFDDEEICIFGWNLKNLFSWLLYRTKCLISVQCRLFDLKLSEAFLGLKNPCPKSYIEAFNRLGLVLKDSQWSKAKTIHQKVYLPLLTEVIPSLESTGIYDKVSRKLLHTYYEIEGQVGGRMNCLDIRGFNPHVISPEQRENLHPVCFDDCFMYFDFSNMEITTLQWLAQDEALKQILDSNEDVYKLVFKLIFGMECDNDKKRELCKSLFLKTLYGMSVEALAKFEGIKAEAVEFFVSRIYKLFPKSFNWIQNNQNISDNFCYDVSGRRRFFDDNEFYKIKNFVVQAPSSLVCHEKLINLHRAIQGYAQIGCYIYDGYIVYCKKSLIQTVHLIGQEVLQAESELIPGLKLKVKCKVGDKLSALKEM